MKKKIFFVASVFFVTFLICSIVNNKPKKIDLRVLTLNNIEALASTELDYYTCSQAGCWWHPDYDCHVYKNYIYLGVCVKHTGWS